MPHLLLCHVQAVAEAQGVIVEQQRGWQDEARDILCNASLSGPWLVRRKSIHELHASLSVQDMPEAMHGHAL